MLANLLDQLFPTILFLFKFHFCNFFFVFKIMEILYKRRNSNWKLFSNSFSSIFLYIFHLSFWFLFLQEILFFCLLRRFIISTLLTIYSKQKVVWHSEAILGYFLSVFIEIGFKNMVFCIHFYKILFGLFVDRTIYKPFCS